jgi:hypothetical protein
MVYTDNDFLPHSYQIHRLARILSVIAVMHSTITFTLLVSLCSIASAQGTTPSISYCLDFGGPDAPGQAGCKTFDVADGMLTAGFEIDQKAFNKLLGGAPSSAKIMTPGLICGIGSKLDHKLQGFLNLVPHCGGERMLLNADQ